MKKYTIAILVNNQSGVLNRVTSMFRRRQFNISCLTVSETESPDYSRITILFEGEESIKKQLINQFYKLPDVISIKELHNEDSVSRELLLIKVTNSPENREEIRAAAEAFDQVAEGVCRAMELAGADGVVLCFGSLYSIADIRAGLEEVLQ
jgi:acetolactate synthase-1/3 small subunit